ncbi:sulfite oxidase-like oxidoreductase [Chelatococcus sp. GCM10030263]|uniref:sulfite oxidase-like oxidoreductase n=1 Tax=Chelatococcus sp. GCM10030263 TaxID=3273387 RepID=UPI00361323D0
MNDESDRILPETKLTTTKQRWAREGKFLTGRVTRPESERLPPGQHLVKDWPVLDLGIQPTVARETWRLDVTGAIDNPVSWDWKAFMDQPQTREVTDIHCVTTWSRYDNGWEGVLTRDLLALVEPKADVHFVMLHSFDGYTTNLPLEDFAAEDAILAHSWNGAPLPREHGGPMRLVVPHLYFWKSAKWLKRIDFRPADQRGFWEERGYHDRGDPWTEERYSQD